MKARAAKRVRPPVSARVSRQKQPSPAELMAQIQLLMTELAEARRAQARQHSQTLEEFLPEWRTRHLTSRVKTSTHNNYEGWLKNHILPAFKHTRLDEIDETKIETWRKGQEAQGYEQHSINSRLKLLKTILRCAVKWNRLGKTPTIFISKKRKEQPHLRENELNTFATFVASHSLEALALVLLGADGGLRRGEIAALQWPHIDFESGDIHIREQRDAKNVTRSLKNDKPRVVAMTARLHEVLASLWAEDEENGHNGHLFHLAGKPISYGTIGKRFKSLLRKSGLQKKVVPHSLRHTFISHLAGKGVPLSDIMALVGHADMRVTQDYIHTNEEQLRSAIEKLNR